MYFVRVSRVDVPTVKRVKRWALSMEELMSDPTGKTFRVRINGTYFIPLANTHKRYFAATGIQEFTNYLRKEYSHENIRFWLAVKDLRRCRFQAQIPDKVNEIFRYVVCAYVLHYFDL